MTFKDLLRVTSRYFDVQERRFHGQERHACIARPRMVVMYLARKVLQMSYPAIGRSLERNHSTVIYDVRKIEKLLGDGDQELASAVSAICSSFGVQIPEVKQNNMQLLFSFHTNEVGVERTQ